MRLASKITIDRWVGTAIIRLLVLLRRISGKQREAGPIQPATIFVLKLLGLGSIIQATPLVLTLKDLHPGARIIFVTKLGNDALTDRIALIDGTVTIHDDGLIPLLSSVLRLLRLCRATPQSCFVNLEAHSKVGAILAMLSGTRWRAGFFRNPRDLVMAPAFDRLVYFNQSAPIAEVYLQLGRALGVKEESPPLADITIKATDHADAARFLAHHDISLDTTRLVLINPNASELRLERRWPAGNFVRLISDLALAEAELFFVLIGSPSEREYVQTILATIPLAVRPSVVNGAGAVSMGGLLALMARASLLVTNDSGPMHMAISFATPTIGMFGPVEPSHYASKTGSHKNIFLYRRIYCSPCVHHFEVAPCAGNNLCMQKISVDEVLSAAQALLRSEAHPPGEDRSILYLDRGKPIGVVGAAR